MAESASDWNSAPSNGWRQPTACRCRLTGSAPSFPGWSKRTNSVRCNSWPSPRPSPTLPDLPPLALLQDQSVLQLEDGLAQRRLLTPLQLKPWSNPDILTNSVVQVVVDAEGRPVSLTLLSGSGSAAADQYALEQAKACTVRTGEP